MIQFGRPYMVRNDGKLFECGIAHPYILYRQDFIKNPSLGNAIQDTIEYVPYSFKWFYNHTRYNETKEKIIDCIQRLANVYITAEADGFDAARYTGFWFDALESILKDFNIVPKKIENKINYPFNHEENFNTVYKYLQDLNNLTNQEFLRMRTGDRFRGNDYTGSVYFRVSSTDFNWYDIIWKIVMNNPNIKNITIEYDVQSGKAMKSYFYELNDGTPITNMDREEFLTAKGTPLIESINYKFNPESEILKQGGSLVEAFGDFGPFHNNNKFETHRRAYITRHFRDKEGKIMDSEIFKKLSFSDNSY